MSDTVGCTCIPNLKVHSKTPVVAIKGGKILWAGEKTCPTHGYSVLGEVPLYPVWKKVWIPAFQAGLIATMKAAGCHPKLLEKRRNLQTNELSALVEFIVSYKREAPEDGSGEYFQE
jgi:hypothetical protein